MENVYAILYMMQIKVNQLREDELLDPTLIDQFDIVTDMPLSDDSDISDLENELPFDFPRKCIDNLESSLRKWALHFNIGQSATSALLKILQNLSWLTMVHFGKLPVGVFFI